MLLCDAAESVGGKLYILGAGWSEMFAGNPTNMALAVKLSIPWDHANRPMTIRASLLNEDGGLVDFGVGPVTAEGGIEVGRPPRMKHGTPLDASFVLNFPGITLTPGGYVWQLEVDDAVKARVPIRVHSQAGI